MMTFFFFSGGGFCDGFGGGLDAGTGLGLRPRSHQGGCIGPSGCTGETGPGSGWIGMGRGATSGHSKRVR